MTEAKMLKTNNDFGSAAPDLAPPALVIDDLSFAYPASNPLFSKLSVRLEQGEFALLVGETGSGKSTLLRLLKNELAPRGSKNGRIEVFGAPSEDIRSYESATQIGYISQNIESQIVCDTVWHELAFGCENVNFSQELIRRRIAELVAFFGIEAWLHAKTSELSGGQKQTLVLASILAMQPRLLLLDEPTSQLDPIAEKNFAHMLLRINRELGVSILLATHEPEALAPYATRIMSLANGRIEKPEQTIPQRLSRFDRPSVTEKNEEPIAGTLTSLGPLETNPFSGQNKEDKQVIKLKAVSFCYDREGPLIFQDLNLSIAQASIHALVGGNGSGKTSLLMMIAGILKPQRGKLINELALSQAYLPQDPQTLFVGDTVIEELREWNSYNELQEVRITFMLERMGLSHETERHPYDLSGGEQQKLALAKLLLTQPRLLLLDEPSRGLDAQTKYELAQTLLELKSKGVTCVLASHDLSFVSQIADTTSMLFDSEVTCTEPTSEFFEKNLFYRPRVDGFIRCWRKEREW